MENILLRGDPLSPSDCDMIAQLDLLPVGDPIPPGWRVLSGNDRYSQIARVALRYEMDEDTPPSRFAALISVASESD